MEEENIRFLEKEEEKMSLLRKDIQNKERGILKKEEKILEKEGEFIKRKERRIIEKEQVFEASKEAEIIERRKQKFIEFLKKDASWIYYLILAVIVWFNIKIRTLPMPGLKDVTTGGWTLGPDLDPFLFLRYAKEIVANGKLAAVDTLRYMPIGFETAKETQLLPYLIAKLHWIINLFGTYTVDYAGVIFPVIVSVFTAIFFFLLVRKVFEVKGKRASNIIALISTAIMMLLPTLLTRTLAGIPEKESIGFCLMFAAFYFFLIAWRAEKIRNAIIFGLLAGVTTAMLALVWGGVTFVYVGFGIVGFLAFVLEKVKTKEFIVFSLWIFSSMMLYIPLTARIDLTGFLISPANGMNVIIWFFMAMYFILFKTKLKENAYVERASKKIPRVFVAIIFSMVIIFILSGIFFGFATLYNMAKGAVGVLNPVPSRLVSTVAENKQPYFGDWEGSMDPIIGGIAIFFWMFFVGSILLFYEMIEPLRKKEKVIMTFSFLIFLITMIFSKYSPSSVFNGTSTLSKATNLLGYLVLLCGVGYVYLKRYADKELEEFDKIKFNYIFIFTLIFMGIVATRSGIRFIMVFTPIATILIGYLVVELFRRAWVCPEGIKKIILWIITIAIIIGVFLIISDYYNESSYTAKHHVPAPYTQQWQEAMAWVRENTPKNAVFGHWWDYGYWLQSIGERATMVDGANMYGYWNYLMGRHVLTAETQQEALNVLYNHNVTYYLIDSSDIGKYSAYSLIGSDEKYDRYSWIGTFLKQPAQTQETKNETVYVYTGGTGFDEDIILQEDGKQTLLPQPGSAIGAVLVYQNQEGGYSQPRVVIVSNKKQYNLPLRYLFIDGKGEGEGKLIDFGENEKNTIGGCAYIFSRVEDSGTVDFTGAAMYLSPRNMRALWVRLYLLGETGNFKLVHNEPSPVHKQFFIPNKISVGEFVYYQGIQGPIKIWRIDYTGKEKYNEEYVQTAFPSSIARRAEL